MRKPQNSWDDLGALRGTPSGALGSGGQVILSGGSDVLKCERDFMKRGETENSQRQGEGGQRRAFQTEGTLLISLLDPVFASIK